MKWDMAWGLLVTVLGYWHHTEKALQNSGDSLSVLVDNHNVGHIENIHRKTQKEKTK